MNFEGLSTEEISYKIATFAMMQMERGASNEEIQSMLVAEGINEEFAAMVVSDLKKPREEKIQGDAQEKIIMGAVIFAIGVTISLVTYNNSEPGGSYIIAWGAIIVGIIQFFRGILQPNK